MPEDKNGVVVRVRCLSCGNEQDIKIGESPECSKCLGPVSPIEASRAV